MSDMMHQEKEKNKKTEEARQVSLWTT